MTRSLLLAVVVLGLAAPALADEPSPPSTSAPAVAASPDVDSAATGAAAAQNLHAPIVTDDLRSAAEGPVGLGDLLIPFARTMLMLLVVIGIAYLTLHKGLGKLVERTQLGKRVKVVERVSLDQRRALYLVEIDGKEMVLAGGEGGVVKIAETEKGAAGATASPTPSLGARFASALSKASPTPPVSGAPKVAEEQEG